MAAVAALVVLSAPAGARAQGLLLDGAPLDVFTDGLGAIQVRQDGVAAGLFYDPAENPAHAGLEIKVDRKVYRLVKDDKTIDTAGGHGETVGQRVERYRRE